MSFVTDFYMGSKHYAASRLFLRRRLHALIIVNMEKGGWRWDFFCRREKETTPPKRRMVGRGTRVSIVKWMCVARASLGLLSTLCMLEPRWPERGGW